MRRLRALTPIVQPDHIRGLYDLVDRPRSLTPILLVPDGFYAPFADDNETLSALDAVRRVVEDVGATQYQPPTSPAANREACERDGPIQKLKCQTLARVHSRAIRQLARRQTVLPKPDAKPGKTEENEGGPAEGHGVRSVLSPWSAVRSLKPDRKEGKPLGSLVPTSGYGLQTADFGHSVSTNENIRLVNSLPMLTPSTSIPQPDWSSIDIVLLDMDGTLLDLRFDNHFWLEVIPQRYAQLHRITIDRAREVLNPRFAAKQGTLDWYCIDFWTQELSLDIAELKRELRENVRFLPGAESFLQALKNRRVRTALVTNAHDQSLAVKAKQTDLTRYFDHVISSHRYGHPKENSHFWVCLQEELGFEPARAMFVDDSLSVLRAARRFGIGQIFAITHPDSSQEGRVIEEFPAVRAVSDLAGAMPREVTR